MSPKAIPHNFIWSTFFYLSINATISLTLVFLHSNLSAPIISGEL